jgi:hypothetical protein
MVFDLNVTHQGFYICLMGVIGIYALSYYIAYKNTFKGMSRPKVGQSDARG